MSKPKIAWWKIGDPNLMLGSLISVLEKHDITIIRTKRLSNEFIDACITNKNKCFIHLHINGMAQTQFEPNIPTVRETFFQLKRLIDSGFPQKQILVVIEPILQNQNGLNAVKLLLKLFTEFKALRLRFVRFGLLQYAKLDKVFVISNQNIAKRITKNHPLSPYLVKEDSFFKAYYDLINEYKSIVTIDKGDEYLIGIRELLPFGLKNEWLDSSGVRHKLIEYGKNIKTRPNIPIVSVMTNQCSNRCLLCPYK